MRQQNQSRADPRLVRQRDALFRLIWRINERGGFRPLVNNELDVVCVRSGRPGAVNAQVAIVENGHLPLLSAVLGALT